MTRDFTLQKYKELCETILASDYKITTFTNYFEENLASKGKGKLLILRHDVDRQLPNALGMAELENALGISSTYYFRMTEEVFQPTTIKIINKMGHEVGYHYEVLDKAEGDYAGAIKLFEEELKQFREVCEIRTISMHGSPLKPWRNSDIWKKYDFKEYDLLGETYISIDYSKMAYYTDTGRRWDGAKYSIDDVVDTSLFETVRTTDELIKLIAKGSINRMCILSHPNRWDEGFGEWLQELIMQNVKNVGKRALKRKRSK